MPRLDELPPELVLYISSFLTRETTITDKCLLPECRIVRLELVPDLPSINALSRTSTLLHHTLNQTLYDLCASLFAVEHQLESTVDKLVAVGVSPDITFRVGHGPRTLLQIAAAMGLRTMVIKLLELYGEEAITKLREPCEDWQMVVEHAIQNNHVDVVRVLAPITVSISGVRVSDETQIEYLSLALLESTRVGNLEISQYLLEQGADINFLRDDYYSVTPLFRAAGAGNLKLVQFLLASGADPNLVSPDTIPLIFKASSVDILQALMASGANIHAVDSHQQNLLSYAKNAEVLRFCLEYGVDPNAADPLSGESALHRACKRNPSEAKVYVELLSQFGATTVEKPTPDGSTPVEIAMSRGEIYFEVVDTLEPHVRDPALRAQVDAWQRAG
ncbi:hypothetical protein MSAN_00055400 [Mycena sanguinolenta]|uniref:Ankyrin n=1 Tax=Mycena sanguinolenta TaxID=230812 RepID=A0A8H6ZFG8_9AGAR|nr:hypothetical protein MSAN_00055400 [Mycena sanguinolenta]